MICWCYRVVVYYKVNPMHVGEDLENVQDCSFHIWSPVGLSESKTVICPVIFQCSMFGIKITIQACFLSIFHQVKSVRCVRVNP